VNCDAISAINTLNLARSFYATMHYPVGRDVSYVRLMCRLCISVGDVPQMRWLYQTAMDNVLQSGSGVLGLGGEADGRSSTGPLSE